MNAALARLDALLREAIETNGGYVFKTVGDAFCSAFPTAPQALAAALTAQRAIQAEFSPKSKVEGPRSKVQSPKSGHPEVAGLDFGPSALDFGLWTLDLRVRMALH